jgi:tRNA (guanine37-N1)-methyltransferase
MKRISYDVIGNLAILKFPKWEPFFLKIMIAKKLLRKTKSLTTILEKKSNVEGNLRIAKVKHLAGLKTTKTNYKENDCTFQFDVAETYFSSRLSNERRIIGDEVAKKAKNNSKILILFSGVGPYPIVIAKKLKRLKKKTKILANELNHKAINSFKRNIVLNKLEDYITIDEGDAKSLPKKVKEKFDIILMPRPNIKETFLKTALNLSKKGTKIYYHGFGTEEKVLNEIKKETKGKILKIKIRKAGDIAPHKFRWQVTFKAK